MPPPPEELWVCPKGEPPEVLRPSPDESPDMLQISWLVTWYDMGPLHHHPRITWRMLQNDKHKTHVRFQWWFIMSFSNIFVFPILLWYLFCISQLFVPSWLYKPCVGGHKWNKTYWSSPHGITFFLLPLPFWTWQKFPSLDEVNS